MTYECMWCRMSYEINNDPMYWLGAAFFSGFLFAGWSWGIVYIIMFILFYEIGYYFYCSYKNKTWDPIIRLGMAAGALMGFLIGRNIIEDDDHEKNIRDFYNNYLTRK